MNDNIGGTPRTEIDRKLDELSEEFALNVARLSSHPVLKKGVLEAAVCDVAWALDHHFPGETAYLADFFGDMAAVLKEKATEAAQGENGGPSRVQ